MRWVGDGQPITQAACEQWLAVTQANYAKRGYGMFALEDRRTGSVLGFCGIVHPGGQPEPEVKYAFLRAYWGGGLATEALTALVAYGARAHALTQLTATAAPANAASHRVLLGIGAAFFENIGEPLLRHLVQVPNSSPYVWHGPLQMY